jgi:hypothetical protein
MAANMTEIHAGLRKEFTTPPPQQPLLHFHLKGYARSIW